MTTTTASKQGTPETGRPAAKLEIEYYTDPLCCWSWSFEPQWRRFRYEYQDILKWKYRMAGMLADWKGYHDPVNAVDRPAQMGPLWKEAAYLSGMPFNERIWVENAPASSYPACFAVKTAALQGYEAAELYLRKIREALMIHGKDIARPATLMETAEELAAVHPQLFDLQQFAEDFDDKKALPHFQEDLDQVKLRGISRYPTLIIKGEGNIKGILITGYRPYEALLETLKPFLLDAKPKTATPEAYEQYWKGMLIGREMEELKNATGPAL